MILIIQNLDPNKLTVMIESVFAWQKLAVNQFVNQCIDTASFPWEWEKANAVQVHIREVINNV